MVATQVLQARQYLLQDNTSAPKLKINDSNILPAIKPMKALVACFSAKPATGKVGMEGQFTDQSMNSPTS